MVPFPLQRRENDLSLPLHQRPLRDGRGAHIASTKLLHSNEESTKLLHRQSCYIDKVATSFTVNEEHSKPAPAGRTLDESGKRIIIKECSSCSKILTVCAMLLSAALLSSCAFTRGYSEVAPKRPGAGPNCQYPNNCPGKVFPRADKQTWMMNASTIIMPCNNSGFTDPESTAGWGVVDFDWSNAKGKGDSPGWVKHSPMDDEEMLFQQVQTFHQ